MSSFAQTSHLHDSDPFIATVRNHRKLHGIADRIREATRPYRLESGAPLQPRIPVPQEPKTFTPEPPIRTPRERDLDAQARLM